MTVPDDVWRAMKEHPEINWSTVARKAFISFVKVLSKAEDTESRLAKEYGPGMVSRVNFGISENYNENKYPGEAGMIGAGFNAGINFNMSITPTINRSQEKKTTLENTLKDALKD
ncbi:hypothetical protein M1329_02070 [Candidatus Marsarchaeota archaeon]|nr:hypothetical protein [Candidatus Marsarchaeota archaeon]